MSTRTASLLLLLFLLAHVALGQEEPGPAPGFAVGPLNLTLKGRAGSVARGEFTVATQYTRKTTHYALEVRDVGQTSRGGRTSVPVGKGVRSCARWIEVPESITIPAGGRKVIPVSAQFPSGAQGAYYAMLTVRLIPEIPEGQTIVVVQPAIAVEVEAQVPGPAPLEIAVKELSISQEDPGAHPSIVLRAMNSGVWKAAIEGDVLLYGPKGTFPISTPIPYTESGNPVAIYPGAEVELSCPMTGAVSPGEYRAVARLLLSGRWQTSSEFDLNVKTMLGGRSLGSAIGKSTSRSEYDIDFRVEPDLVELPVPPGATRSIPIKVQNQDDREVRVQLDVSEVRMEPSGLFTYPATAGVEGGWVTVSPDTLTVPPRRTKTIVAQVAVPKDRPESGALVRSVRVRATAESDDSDWASVAECGVLIVAVDTKAAPAELEVRSLDLIRPKPDMNPTAAVLRVKNQGSRVARLTGSIALERAKGQRIVTLKIGSEQEEILLPGGEREFRMPLGPLDAGQFSVQAEVAVAGEAESSATAKKTFTSTTAAPTGL